MPSMPMRPHRGSPRAASVNQRIASATRRGTARLAVAALSFLAACEAPTEVARESRLAPPSGAQRVLTGGSGTPIFPDALPSEYQVSGDARGLNNSGQVTGAQFGLVTTDQDFKPYRWSTDAGIEKLVGCCGTQWGNDINDAGVVVGTTQANSVALGNRAFVATGTSMVLLPILPGGDPELSSTAMAINNAGQIVGVSSAPGFVGHAVLWSPGGASVQDLGTLGGSNSIAIDINASGQVIGSSQIAGNTDTHFFLWSAGTGMQDLNTLLGPVVSVVEINDAGQIAGSYVAPGGGTHAFLYTPGSGLLDLGTLGGTTSAPTGLNSRGEVVGSSTLADGSTHAFLWTPADGMEDITAKTGIPAVRRLNDNLQTLSGAQAPSTSLGNAWQGQPRLVQLMVTQSNKPPTALFTFTCNGLTCTFDARASLDDKPGVTYAWKLNRVPGGDAFGPVVTTTYPAAGPRTIRLIVSDAGGLKDTMTKVITLPTPVAAFTVSCTGLTCTFDASTSSPGRQFWMFGDGNEWADTPVYTHTYAKPGTYDVTLQVKDANPTLGTITKQVTVSSTTPTDAPPVARFTASCSGKLCTFDAATSTDDVGIDSYAWAFSAHSQPTASGVKVIREYAPGTRNVTLVVTDTKGQTHSVTQSVTN